MRNRYYKTKKVVFEGITFDSKAEMQRYLVLREAEKEGLISGLRRQVSFTLIPRQTETLVVKLKTKTKIVERFREHPVTEDYVLKRKMMRFFGHPITEVFDPSEGYPEIAARLGLPLGKSKKNKKKKSSADKECVIKNSELF